MENITSCKTTNDALSVFSENTVEYQKLHAAAIAIQAFTGKQCKIDTVYFDQGQNWLYTTILMVGDLKTFPYMQILSPKQQFEIVYGDMCTWFEVVKEVVKTH